MAKSKKKPAKRKAKGTPGRVSAKSRKAIKDAVRKTAEAKNDEPTPEAIAAAEGELAMRQVIGQYLMLPTNSIGRPGPVKDAEGADVPGLTDVVVRVNLQTATAYAMRRNEEERRRAGAVGR